MMKIKNTMIYFQNIERFHIKHPNIYLFWEWVVCRRNGNFLKWLKEVL